MNGIRGRPAVIAPKIIAYVAEHGPVSAKAVAVDCGITLDSAYTTLRKLMNSGKLKREVNQDRYEYSAV